MGSTGIPLSLGIESLGRETLAVVVRLRSIDADSEGTETGRGLLSSETKRDYFKVIGNTHATVFYSQNLVTKISI